MDTALISFEHTYEDISWIKRKIEWRLMSYEGRQVLLLRCDTGDASVKYNFYVKNVSSELRNYGIFDMRKNYDFYNNRL